MKTVLVTIPCIFYLFLPAANAEDGQSWVGFKPTSDPSVPAAVSKASKSVFQIIYPHGEPTVLDPGSVDMKTLLSDDDNWFKAVQLKVCIKQNIKNCPVMPKTYSGTAFLIRDQMTIATNLHNVQGWLFHAKKNNP